MEYRCQSNRYDSFLVSIGYIDSLVNYKLQSYETCATTRNYHLEEVANRFNGGFCFPLCGFLHPDLGVPTRIE
jgi:hypothetical protein